MSFLRPRLILALGATIAVTLLVSLTQEMSRRWQVQREITALQAEVAAAEKTVIEFENLNQYFRTDDFQERLAREKLNYQAPNERVILIPHGDTGPTAAEPATAAARRSIPERWWRVFFIDEPISSS